MIATLIPNPATLQQQGGLQSSAKRTDQELLRVELFLIYFFVF